jgi:hypothetical protein
MDKFSIEECKVMWFKNAEMTPNQKQVMKTELKTMSGIIADAMKFIHKKQLERDREIYVRITFNTEEIWNYMLEITKEGDEWAVDIIDFDNRFAGNILNEIWSIYPRGNDTDYDPPETI